LERSQALCSLSARRGTATRSVELHAGQASRSRDTACALGEAEVRDRFRLAAAGMIPVMEPSARTARRDARPQPPLDALLVGLDPEELREILAWAADWHEDVECKVRLRAARLSGDLTALRDTVDGGLRTRRFLDWRAGREWARDARPIVAELEAAADRSSSRELVELLERAIGHVVKVLQTRADDSSGLIGDLARDLLGAHARAWGAGGADPPKRAAWIVRFRLRDQDFFEADPVRYRDALGDRGLAALRRAVAHEPGDGFSVRWFRERLAILDGDTEQIVTLLGGDLTQPHQYIQVAEAMAELGREDEMLRWCKQGIERTSGWQTSRLYELACDIHARRQQPLEVLALRRSQHERSPTSSTYAQLKAAADHLDAWPLERDAALDALRRRDPGELIDALLREGDTELAWQTATAADSDLGLQRWLRLAEAREASHPADAMPIYWQAVDEALETADRRNYAQAVRILRRARTAASAAGQEAMFQARLGALREQHRRRPTLIAMLNKAKLDAPDAEP